VATILAVTSAVTLHLDVPVTATAGTSYTLLYGGNELGGGSNHMAKSLLLGAQQGFGTLAREAGGLNIVGPANSNTGLSVYPGDLYAGFNVLGYAHDNVFVAFDASYNTGDGNWYSSHTSNAWRINKNGGKIDFDLGIPSSGANSVINTWATAVSLSQSDFTVGTALRVTGFNGGYLTGSSGTQLVETAAFSTGSGTFGIAGACVVTANYQYQRIGNTVTLFVDVPTCNPSVATDLHGNLATPLSGLLPSAMVTTTVLGAYGLDAVGVQFRSDGTFRMGYMLSTEVGVGNSIPSVYSSFVAVSTLAPTRVALVYHL
jgi:hypothetical protein